LKSFESYDANSYQHPFQPGGCIITTLFFLNFLKICQKNKRPISQHSFFSQILNQNEQINFSSTQNLNPQIPPKSIHISLSLSLSTNKFLADPFFNLTC
jgi:hypothetical protein